MHTPISDIIRERIEHIRVNLQEKLAFETRQIYVSEKFGLEHILKQIQPLEENSLEAILERMPEVSLHNLSQRKPPSYYSASMTIHIINERGSTPKVLAGDGKTPTEALLSLEKKLQDQK